MLDPDGRREVLDTIHRLNRERGITVVLITHHMDGGRRGGPCHCDERRRGRSWTARPERFFAQVERLHELGLAAPDTVELLQRLNQAGAEHLPLTAITVEECADAPSTKRFGAEGK